MDRRAEDLAAQGRDQMMMVAGRRVEARSIGGECECDVTCHVRARSSQLQEMQKNRFQSPMSRPPRSDLYKHPFSLCSPRLFPLPSYPPPPPFCPPHFLPSIYVRGRLPSLWTPPPRRRVILLLSIHVLFLIAFAPVVHIAVPIVKTQIFRRPPYHRLAVLFHPLISDMPLVEKFPLCFLLLSV